MRCAVARRASNAGTLTLHMTRAALVPYAIRAWKMWMNTDTWLGHGVLATSAPGLSLAFTESEKVLLQQRAAARREYGAQIDLLDRDASLAVEPGLNPAMLQAAYCATDGFASAYLTGRAFHAALREAVYMFSSRHRSRASSASRECIGCTARTTPSVSTRRVW